MLPPQQQPKHPLVTHAAQPAHEGVVGCGNPGTLRSEAAPRLLAARNLCPDRRGQWSEWARQVQRPAPLPGCWGRFADVHRQEGARVLQRLQVRIEGCQRGSTTAAHASGEGCYHERQGGALLARSGQAPPRTASTPHQAHRIKDRPHVQARGD